MRNVALVLVCLACAGHGRRMQVGAGQAPSDSLVEIHKPLEDMPSSQSLLEIGEPKGRNPLKTVLKLLLALNPAAQYGTAGQVQEPPPWYSRMFTAGIVDAVVQAVKQVRSLNSFPFVTSFLCALSVVAHYFTEKAFTVYDYALQPSSTWQKRLLSWELVASSFMHTSVEHLVDDLSPLLSYGSMFEDHMPSTEFLKLISWAIVAPNALLVVGTKLWAHKAKHPEAIAAHESIYVDFAGTLWCLVTIFRNQILAAKGQTQSIHGVPVPVQYAWVDLFIQKLTNPGMPIAREVSGLLAGLGYVYYDSLLRFFQKRIALLDTLQKRVLLAAAVIVSGMVLLS